MSFVDSLGDDWKEDAEGQEPEVSEQTVEQPEQVEEETPSEPQAPEAEKPVDETEAEKFSPTLYREMKEERRKRQELERQLQAVQAKQPAPQPEAQKFRDAYEDPDGFTEDLTTTLEKAKWEVRAELSGFQAEQKFGKETVEEALAWAQQHPDPTLGLRVRNAPSPVEYVVQEYQQSRTLERIGGKSFEDAAKEYAASQGWIVSQPGAEAPIQKPSSPAAPQGLARSPGKGGVGQAPQGADWGEVQFALDR